MMVESNQVLAGATGVLLHPTALPNSPVCGSFGAPARNWLKYLACNGIGVWQFLPLAPPDSTGSPYSSPSSFAYNPWFLDVDDLVEQGFLDSSLMDELPVALEGQTHFVDFDLADLRSKTLGRLLLEGWANQGSERHLAFDDWCREQFWLEDHASFMELRRQFQGLPWWQWPEKFSLREESSLNSWKNQHQNNLLEHRLLQWHLDRQWQVLRMQARELGVLLFGDLPFYVSRDSADVWSNRSLFSVFPEGELEFQSGVPPDYFSNTGQLWGTPVYRWKNHQNSEFRWWRSRFARHWQQMDLLRLDHFRALYSYWSVPGDKETAEDGEWLPSPGSELLELLRDDCNGRIPLVAEDLGIITSGVEELRTQFSLPGMKILQFAFDGDLCNPHLPENFHGNAWVAYTGTHDNPTTLGWWKSLNEEVRERVFEEIKNEFGQPCWQLLEIGLASKAKLFVAPLQDILCLDDDARFNKPGSIVSNWRWRLDAFNAYFFDSLKLYGERGIFWGRSFDDAASLLKFSSSL